MSRRWAGSTERNMKHTRTILTLLVVLAAAGAAFGAPAIEKLLPAKDAVKGWSILPSSLQYGKGDDISKIYNGGYELYTKNGVIDAARQMYQRGNDYVEVTIHTMKSPKAATDFVRYWQKENKQPKLEKTKRSTGFVATKPSVTAYYATGKYLTTVSAFHDAGKATKDVKAFVGVIESKAAKG